MGSLGRQDWMSCWHQWPKVCGDGQMLWRSLYVYTFFLIILHSWKTVRVNASLSLSWVPTENLMHTPVVFQKYHKPWGKRHIGDVRPRSPSSGRPEAARLLFSDSLPWLRLNPLMLTKTFPVPVRKAFLLRFRQAAPAARQAGSVLHVS